jgi:hypothetical protein
LLLKYGKNRVVQLEDEEKEVVYDQDIKDDEFTKNLKKTLEISVVKNLGISKDEKRKML